MHLPALRRSGRTPLGRVPLGLVRLGLVLVLIFVAAGIILWQRGELVPGRGDTPLGKLPSVVARGSLPPSGAPRTDAVILAAGDIGFCGSNADRDTARLVQDLEGTVLAIGDLAYEDGSAKEFKDCYDPTWGRFKDRTKAVPGNHDWQSAGLAGYKGYWGLGTSATDPTWYSFDLGAWHIVALDADCGHVDCRASSPQVRWLVSDLAQSHASCTLAMWHQPRFSSGEHGNDAAVAPFWDALAAAGADVVLNGHDHDYERFGPQLPNGTLDSERGIREFVVGTGGAGLRGFQSVKPNSRIRISTVHGVLRMVLRPKSYDWGFLGVDGSTLDEGHGTCH